MTRCQLPLRAFVDPEFSSWMPGGLPPALQHDIEAAGFAPSWDTPVDRLFGEGVPPELYAKTVAEILVGCHDKRNPYHQLWHGQLTAERCFLALRALDAVFGVLPAELVLASVTGAAGHDFGHPGATFFALVADAARLPADLADPHATPVEYYSAIRVDAILQRAGWSVAARWLAVYVIYATAYGAHTDLGKQLGIHKIQPAAIIGRLLRLCDVMPPAEHCLSMNLEIGVTMQEKPADAPPKTFAELLDRRVRFLGHVERLCDDLDATVSAMGSSLSAFSLTQLLGWRGIVNVHAVTIAEVIAGENPFAEASIRAKLTTAGIVLP